jgi:hypothetical protein
MANERHSSIRDYSHWNEEASIIKAQEDRYADYYADEPDYDSEPYEREPDELCDDCGEEWGECECE